MNHIYLGLTLSLICLFLLYLTLSKVLLVTVLCVILAGLYFKDDFILFRYIAAHVALFYSWICEIFYGIQTMYHQSNNTNFPVRKSIQNNGAVPRKFERLNHGSASYNLSTSYVIDNQPLNSGVWDSSSKLSSPLNSYTNQSKSTLQEMSKLNINHRVREEKSPAERHWNLFNSSSVSPLIPNAGYSRSTDSPRGNSSSFLPSLDHTTNIENKPPLNTQLYADVTSPGFCGRVAERLHEEMMTHQSKYDTVGAFPVVNFKSQSPKIKIKTPVRVRLAPPSNEMIHHSYGANIMTRSPALVQDDSMKSVLQVLKEISRKRIHSHVDSDAEEGSKRLRVTDSQFDSDGLLHTSLLQQTIQGKRAREESSPNNEDDKKRRKASLKNNEIMSSLSSSISIRPPHLQTAKRKAQSIDDSITSTPVLGKLLKVQTEITPPAPTNNTAAPGASAAVEKLKARTSLSPAIPSPIAPPPTVVEPAPVKTSAAGITRIVDPEPEEDGAVSRLLGRMSDQTSCSRPIHIPVKKNVFMSTNDLSLSPPKENRLAAMIAVLGGPSEQSELENIQSEAPKYPDRLIKGKALFTTPETPATPDTPKQNKKVTFSDSLTTTKIFERDEPENGNPTGSSNPLGPPSTPLSSVTFGTSVNKTPTEPKLNFGTENSVKPFALNFGSPVSSGKEADKPNESFSMTTPISSAAGVSSPGSQTSMFQMQPTSLNFTSASSPANVSGPITSVPAQASSSNAVNTSSSGGFSFGSNSSLVNPSKESLPKLNTDSPSVKPFSFGSESKTAQPAQPISGFPSLFSSSSNNGDMKATEAVSGSAQNKPMFNMFGNKDNSSATSKNESENKPMVNGFAPAPSSSSPFAMSQPVSQANANKPFPNFAANANSTTTSQSAPTFNFGSNTAFSKSASASSTTQQSTPSSFTSTTQQANSAQFQPNHLTSAAASPALNMFNSSTSSPAQSKPSPFGSGIQGTPAFGDSVFKPVSSSSQTPKTNSVFGSTPSQTSAFGSSPALQNGAVSSTSQSSNIFGNISSSKPITFGSGPNATTQPSTAFGFSATPASTQASSPFGITLNNSTTSTPTMFGTTTTAQSTSVFGSATASTGPQSSTFPTPSTTAGQTSLFGSIVSNDTSKNIFAGASNSNPTFGGSGNTSTPTFGNQSNPAPTFGSQNTTAAPAFGSQSAPAFSFGSQSTGSTPAQGGFGSAGSFGASSNTSSTNEVKPPAFGSASPFMFGNSSASKPTETVKPLGTAAPFAFGSNAQQSSSVNPSVPSVPSFGGPTPSFGANQPTPTFGASQTASTFGASQPAPTFGASQPTPTFGASQPTPTFGASQPTPTFGASQQTPTFGSGSSQPAAPTFQFGQTSSSAAPAFQFNAAPPTAGGGMFSIGSGGSSTSRPKTTALRRSHKRT